MKLEPPVNENYAATVVTLPKLKELEGCDNLLGASLFGFQCLVDRSHSPGELGVVFGAETQLSDEYCRENNLYRHADRNKDEGETGYLEDTRRVRAIKLRGHRSDCLFMPLESLAYTGDVSDLKVGDVFDKINGHDICNKYVIKTKGRNSQQKAEKKFNRVDPKLFPEHIDTDNYFRNSRNIPDDQWVWVTQKVHGTSWRGTRTQVLRRLSWRERLAKRLGVKVDHFEWDTVAGSRKVIKDPNNPDSQHFYDSDIWTGYLTKVEDSIPEGYIIYGELIGYTPEGGEIQSGYTYGVTPGQCRLFVYRVAVVNARGLLVDLSWPQVKEFCTERGLDHVPELWAGPHSQFVAEDWIDKRLRDSGFTNALPLSGGKKFVDEGVCIRADRLRPTILKAKSPIFLAHETKLLDKGETNLEDEGSLIEEEA